MHLKYPLTPSCVDFPNFWIFSITSSNLEYETEHRLGSIKSFTLSPKGDDRWLINLQPSLLLGTTPTGLRRKFDIGFSVKKTQLFSPNQFLY